MRKSLLLALALLAALPAGAQAAKSQITTFEAPRDLLDASQRPKALDELESLGVKHLRVVLYWKNVAPSPDARVKPDFDELDPSSYSWGQYDELLTAAKDRGWSVLLTVSGPVPRWATNGAKDTTTRPSPNEFRMFMTAVAARFGDRVAQWSIWNEPNHPQFLQPQYDSKKRPLSPKVYRGLYAAALRGLDDAGDAKPVLIAETAPIGTGKDVAPLTFLRGVLCLNAKYRKTGGCGRLRIDGWSHHAYTRKAGPYFVPDGPNDVTIGVLGRLTKALDRAANAGVVKKGLPIHLTEFGIQSEPDPFAGVSFQRQAEYRSISEQIAYDNPRVRSFSQYLLRDDAPVAGASRLARYGGFESGLRSSSGKAKPALDGFRLPLVASRASKRSSKVRLWGLVRPGEGTRTVELQVRSGSGSWRRLATVTSNARGYFSFGTRYAKGRQWRVRWQEAGGGATRYGAPTRAYAKP
ncbi:cellulase family glycosylhydrolase [Conexibacter sp. SYSU D00693]|uniref:cellulase family glycosylhydrolase n=1 Tax=Conexibacter sp. SYSU D00693 TaxID=2812560 RepID=UPI00196A809D|nr:cellulase family glycosylhydrolase [Conexibacter sp. SYSU D00693]